VPQQIADRLARPGVGLCPPLRQLRFLLGQGVRCLIGAFVAIFGQSAHPRKFHRSRSRPAARRTVFIAGLHCENSRLPLEFDELIIPMGQPRLNA